MRWAGNVARIGGGRRKRRTRRSRRRKGIAYCWKREIGERQPGRTKCINVDSIKTDVGV
jgi:hypothetical protein